MDTDEVTRHLKKALSAIDEASSSLNYSKVSNDGDVQSAISDLDDAETEIKRAIRELDD